MPGREWGQEQPGEPTREVERERGQLSIYPQGSAYDRWLDREEERHESVRLFEPAPPVMPGQTVMPTVADVPPHLRGAISPERWAQMCRES